MAGAFAEIAFTPSVRAAQEKNGSADMYAQFLDDAGRHANRRDGLGPEEAAFIAERDGFYQATVSETGWPYVQFRGGPRGFLKALDRKTVAYADYRGNRQYLSVGNVAGNDRVSLILMDYPNRRRLKIWGRARVVEDPSRIADLFDEGYRAKPERVVEITVEAIDWNCPQHIPQRFTLDELEAQLGPIRAELARLQAENDELRSFLNAPSPSKGGADA